MKFKIHVGFGLVVALALLGGCAVGPNYHRLAVNAPDNFRFAGSRTTNSLADLSWWEVFNDPMLQAQQDLYPTQRAQVQTQAGELIDVVQLYRSLGGGWQNTNTMLRSSN